MNDGVLRLCDLAAESLILCDVQDPESIDALVAALVDLAAAFDDAQPDHPAQTAVDAARGIRVGDSTALGAIEMAFREARLLAEQAVRIEGEIGSSRSEEVRARKRAPGRIAAPEPARVDPAGGEMPLAGDVDLMNDFVVRANEHLDDADARLLDLEQMPGDREMIDAVFRAFHTIKGMAGFLALDSISERAHHYESMLSPFRVDGASLDEAVIDAMFTGVDEMRRLVAVAGGILDPESTSAQLHDQRDGAQSPGTSAAAGSVGIGASTREGTVRVAEGRLDVLLDTIGELVIAESMASASVRDGSDSAVVGIQLERLDKITRELQHMATSLRMVPLKATFGRMARLVRDLSHKSSKPVEFVMGGEDTELDKAVVDRIQDPLIHALRNAVDHGIESAKARKAAGKPIEARIELRAFHAGGAIHIEVSDDGGGIDLGKVAEKARRLGMLDHDEEPTEERLLEILFEPGFSTAATVTDVSGRGVGMDVVRRTVEELRGRIDLTSEPGVGTTISIRLPVTLAIIDGMVCRIGVERYIVPVLSIERSVRPAAADLTTVIERGLMLDTGHGLLPIVRLHELLGVPDAQVDPTEAVVIIVSEGGLRAGLLVCELLGQQQTVIKPLGDGLPDQPGITGGAIMPDGLVGLILDAAGLVRLAHRREG